KCRAISRLLEFIKIGNCLMFRTYPPLASLKERLSFLFENDPRSQSVIAKQAGISQPSFSDLLTGRTSTSKHLEKIAE
ncbi:hypothetical protein, partial [Siminovitchia fortis]|uniref:hypothetical protein n=1 Tax=Siminovitchia fortis TaxID=254758 RepID=UPI001C97789E